MRALFAPVVSHFRTPQPVGIAATCCLAMTCISQATTPATDLLYGHFESHLEYQHGRGWNLSVSYDTDNDFNSPAGVVRLDPAQTRLIVAPAARTQVPNPPGTFSRFGPAGSPLWILPQSLPLGTPVNRLFLGVRAVVNPGVFQMEVGGNFRPDPLGSIALELVSVSGTGPAAGGHFAVWKTESLGTVVFPFDTTNGISSADRIGTIPTASHTHYNWGFTRPGTYDVRMRASGRLMPALGGTTTSAETTYRFVVPFSSRIPNSAELRFTGGPAGPGLFLADPPNAVAYATDRAMLEAASAASTASQALLPGAAWEMNLSLRSEATFLPNGVGIPTAQTQLSPPASSGSNLHLDILSVRGPGRLAFLSDTQVVADDAGDAIPLTLGSFRNLRVACTSSGIYRITARARQSSSQSNSISSSPFTITLGAGLTADFNYAQWASSFERSANLATGSLTNRQADPDRDGLPNSVEFACFWHGLDPTVADADRMPVPSILPDSTPRFSFLRDSFKDPLDESRWQILPGFSQNLSLWQFRSPRSPGYPLELTESGAEEGNACGAILHRALRLPSLPTSIPPSRAFFRLQVIPSNAF